jgi:hypothetical protein
MEQGQKKEIVIVFISGFLSPPSWISYPQHHIPSNVRMITVTPSATGSLHDRAIQIFYQLKGGRVNYGKEHAEYHGHAQYGDYFSRGDDDQEGSSHVALYPEWDEDHPVILVGHSFGGVTAWALQSYLQGMNSDISPFKQDYPDVSERWVRGVITVNTPLNGAIKTYQKGMHSHQIPIISFLSQGHAIALMVHLTEYLNIPWLRNYLDLDQRAWQMRWNRSKSPILSIFLLFLSFLGYGVHTNTDNLSYYVTLHSIKEWSTTSHWLGICIMTPLVWLNVLWSRRKRTAPTLTSLTV